MFLVLALSATVSCAGPTIQASPDTPDTNIRAIYYTTQDTIVIRAGPADPLRYGKAEFNAIVDTHPELYADFVQEPDHTYALLPAHGRFGGEAGRDEYYILYAYFLRRQHGLDKYADRRARLTSIYENINALHALLQHGGTYFGHQYARMVGYAEYALYLFAYKGGKLSKSYDVAAQKRLYIAGLRQLVEDELRTDTERSEEERKAVHMELARIVSNVERAITDVFYLRCAQEFEYRHYAYY